MLGNVNVYPPPFAICRVRIGRQVAHLGPWRTIYNYQEANLSVSAGMVSPSTGTCTIVSNNYEQYR